jgi:dsDNA-binding SOS-regulon protein
MIPDWHHVNAVAYNPELDQIMVSLRLFSEFWVIDHGTTTGEAASHQGGRSGKGGDLLYRWGNPRAYRAGTKADQKLFYQHDAHWIPRGRPGEGHVIVFNNGDGRTAHNFSSVDEIVLPVDSRGRYQRDPNGPFGPREAVWSYTAPKKEDFFSAIMSGANRLPNGNTLVCSSMNATIFEVTPDKEVVWKYVNPDKSAVSFGGRGSPRFGAQGANPARGAPPLADVLPPRLQFALQLKTEQRKQLDDLQRVVVGKLETVLNEEQKKLLREKRSSDAFGSLVSAGQLVPLSTQVVLKLTAEQKEQLSTIQKDVDDKLSQVLDAGQKQRIKEMREMSARGGGAGFGPRGFGGMRGGPPVFRAYRYGPDYPGLVGKDLTPGKRVEELQPEQPPKPAAR